MRNVSIARGDSVVLHEIDLDIALGEHVALLGPNGCGKSTLIKALTRELYPVYPLPGEPPMRCTLLGRERWDLSQLRSSFGVVASELPGERTSVTGGLDSVIAGFFGASTLWPNHTVTSQMRQQASETLDLMRAGHLAARLVGQMSAGEQRRVMIARAMVHRPRMLLLDEPSNALDLMSQQELRSALRAVARQGTGIILVTHQIGDIVPEIERLVLMREGRIVADGARSELLTATRLSRLFGVSVELAERDGFMHAW